MESGCGPNEEGPRNIEECSTRRGHTDSDQQRVVVGPTKRDH